MFDDAIRRQRISFLLLIEAHPQGPGMTGQTFQIGQNRRRAGEALRGRLIEAHHARPLDEIEHPENKIDKQAQKINQALFGELVFD